MWKECSKLHSRKSITQLENGQKHEQLVDEEYRRQIAREKMVDITRH